MHVEFLALCIARAHHRVGRERGLRHRNAGNGADCVHIVLGQPCG